MQVQRELFETPAPAGAARVWAALDKQQRIEVVRALAHLIAKTAAKPTNDPAAGRREETDE